ncbi:hypothetical protein HGRIS_011282 [Hohenbuehelia grisea]|uniref:Uncharacterized protein n=1 Tax=Hohenbuehelia grisea TaxID=104357 RepID=A0ABR3JVK2_9AGAR
MIPSLQDYWLPALVPAGCTRVGLTVEVMRRKPALSRASFANAGLAWTCSPLSAGKVYNQDILSSAYEAWAKRSSSRPVPVSSLPLESPWRFPQDTKDALPVLADPLVAQVKALNPVKDLPCDDAATQPSPLPRVAISPAPLESPSRRLKNLQGVEPESGSPITPVEDAHCDEASLRRTQSSNETNSRLEPPQNFHEEPEDAQIQTQPLVDLVEPSISTEDTLVESSLQDRCLSSSVSLQDTPLAHSGALEEDTALRSSRSLPSFVVLPSFLLPSFSLRFFKRDKPTSQGAQELDGAHSTTYVGPSASGDEDGSPVIGSSGHPDSTPSKPPSLDFVKHARHQETADSILEYYSGASGPFEAGDEKEPQHEPRDEHAAELDDFVDCASDFETTTTSSSSSSITAVSASQTLESTTSEHCLPLAAPSTLSQDLSLTLPNPSPRPGAEDSPRRSLPFASSTTAKPKTPLINPSHRRFPSSAKPATSVKSKRVSLVPSCTYEDIVQSVGEALVKSASQRACLFLGSLDVFEFPSGSPERRTANGSSSHDAVLFSDVERYNVSRHYPYPLADLYVGYEFRRYSGATMIKKVEPCEDIDVQEQYASSMEETDFGSVSANTAYLIPGAHSPAVALSPVSPPKLKRKRSGLNRNGGSCRIHAER